MLLLLLLLLSLSLLLLLLKVTVTVTATVTVTVPGLVSNQILSSIIAAVSFVVPLVLKKKLLGSSNITTLRIMTVAD